MSQDPLLKSTSVAIKVVLVLVGAFIAIAALVLCVLMLVPERAQIIGAGQHVDRGVVIGWTKATLAKGVIVAALLFLILRRVRRIVDSAMSGDPFLPENALLLRQIGWLMLAINSVQIVYALASRLMLRGQSGIFLDIACFGLFATLLIFVLARVFKRGSEMRADLAGTV
jgi:hypothetical protein